MDAPKEVCLLMIIESDRLLCFEGECACDLTDGPDGSNIIRSNN